MVQVGEWGGKYHEEMLGGDVRDKRWHEELAKYSARYHTWHTGPSSSQAASPAA